MSASDQSEGSCPSSGFTYNPDSGTSGTSGTTPYPPDYTTVRVTVSHIDMKSMLSKIFDGYSYICYPHKGQKTHKEHVHVLIPALDAAGREVIKKRLTRSGYSGNACYSIKGMHNGLDKGIQYASKEGTIPIICGDFAHYVNNAPKWEPRESMHNHFASTDKPDRTLRDWQLTYSNLVSQAVHYAKVNKLGSNTLRETVKDMIQTTRWRPSKQMLTSGVPDFYMKDYEFRMGHRKEPDMDWFSFRS